jgi:Secretion system C-terminal sorting domain
MTDRSCLTGQQPFLKHKKNMRNARLLGQACFTLLLIVFLSTPLSQAQITVTLPDLQASVGQTISVPVDLANVESSSGFNSFQFQVVSSNPGLVFEGHDATSTIVDIGSWSVNSSTTSNLVGGFASSQPENIVGTSGTLVYILIRVDSFSAGDTIQLQDFRLAISTGGELFSTPDVPSAEFPSGVAVGDEDELPESFVLKGNYPNPFNPTTNIQFDLRESATVQVTVMDMLGREMISMPAQAYAAGANHTVSVNAASLTSGMYIYRVVANSATDARVATGTMTLLK